MAEHIQINDVQPRIHYVADGIQSAFSFPFAIFRDTDLEVWQGDAKLSAGYAVSGAGNSTGGTAILAAPPPPGTGVTLRRRLVVTRTTDFQSDGLIRAKSLNDELDFQVAAIQQVADDLGRAVRRSPTSASTADLTLPEPAPRRALRWNDSGTALVNTDHDPDAVGDATRAAAEAGEARDVAVAARVEAQAAVGGVRVSLDDALAAPLSAKLLAGPGIVMSTSVSGGDQCLVVASARPGIGDPWSDRGSGSALVLDGDGDANLAFVMTGTTAITAANLEEGKVYSFLIRLHQDDVGGRAFLLPAGTRWPYGEVPTWPTGAGQYAIFVLSTWDAGVSWLGAFVGAEYV